MSWLWGSCINKSSYIILFCVLLSSNAPIDEAFSLIIWVPDSIVIARTKKRTGPHCTTQWKTWQLLPLDFVEPRFCPINLRRASDSKSRSTQQEDWDSPSGAVNLDEMWMLQWMRVSNSMHSSVSFVGGCAEKKWGCINRMSWLKKLDAAMNEAIVGRSPLTLSACMRLHISLLIFLHS